MSDEIVIYFTNCIIKFTNNDVILFYPRDSFNKRKTFITPPKKIISSYNRLMDYNLSNTRSIIFFLNNVKLKRSFDLKSYVDAIKTLEFFI